MLDLFDLPSTSLGKSLLSFVGSYVQTLFILSVLLLSFVAVTLCHHIQIYKRRRMQNSELSVTITIQLTEADNDKKDQCLIGVCNIGNIDRS